MDLDSFQSKLKGQNLTKILPRAREKKSRSRQDIGQLGRTSDSNGQPSMLVPETGTRLSDGPNRRLGALLLTRKVSPQADIDSEDLH
jgi:hypothetical protein